MGGPKVKILQPISDSPLFPVSPNLAGRISGFGEVARVVNIVKSSHFGSKVYKGKLGFPSDIKR